jgi:hypothetical protein
MRVGGLAAPYVGPITNRELDCFRPGVISENQLRKCLIDFNICPPFNNKSSGSNGVVAITFASHANAQCPRKVSGSNPGSTLLNLLPVWHKYDTR